MVRIVHISDLHFGTVVQELCDPLLDEIAVLQPRLVVISGDLTQRAKEWQFAEAAEFLKRISQPKLVVPGNHDVPLWNVWNRFYKPLDRYKRYISADLEPEYQDDEIIVLSINTARSFVWKGGRISFDQMTRLENRLNSASPGLFKAVVMHHPIVPLERAPGLGIVGRAKKALEILEKGGVALIMAGHGHDDYIGKSTARYGSALSSILVAHAGTALSNRTRGARNSFNLLDVHGRAVELVSYAWDQEARDFISGPRIRYEGLGLTPSATPELVEQPEMAPEVRKFSRTIGEKP
jgi:3',5'-cyclic AMP phosphodiesterase CpdA